MTLPQPDPLCLRRPLPGEGAADPCPGCRHAIAMHVGEDTCLGCAIMTVPATLLAMDQRIRKLERGEGIRLI